MRDRARSARRAHLAASRKSGAQLVALATALLLSLLPQSAHATGDPTLVWWTIETAHFKVTYPEQLDGLARRIAAVSEAFVDPTSAALSFSPSDKTEVLLTDDSEAANGSATPVPYDAIRLYASAPGDLSALGDYDDWYRSLAGHEYTHILHTGNIRGLSALLNRILGRQFAPNAAQPRWIIEGLAVVLESELTSGGRIRASLFDTFLRADVLDDRIAGLDQISSGAQRWPFGNLYYLYGSRFVQWITDVYGKDTYAAVSADYAAAPLPFGIHRSIRRATGRTYEQLYDAWVEHLRTRYRDEVRAVDARGRREGSRITFHGRTVSYPRFLPTSLDPQGETLLYYRDDAVHRSGIHRLRLGAAGASESAEDELVARTVDETSASFAPNGELFFASLDVWRNLYSRSDLFSLAPGEASTFGTEPARTRHTEGLRATDPDVSPDGRLVVFVTQSKGTRSLAIADRATDGTIANVRALLRPAEFEQVFTPRFSPDGTRIAFSAWRTGGDRDVRVLDLATQAITSITSDRALDLQPVWSPDGGTIYFSSDRTGIFNVYAHELASGTTLMVTNVTNAALMPAIRPDGRMLVYVGYTSAGFDLYSMPLDPSRMLPAPIDERSRPAPAAEPEVPPMERYPYRPWTTFGPRSYFVGIGLGDYGSTAVTVTTSAFDLVGKHSLSAELRVDPGAPEPRVALEYAYGMLPFDWGLSLRRSTVPRTGGYVVGETEVPWNESLTTLGSSVLLPIRAPFFEQSISLGYSASLSDPRIDGSGRLDPLAVATVVPDDGLLSLLRFGYGFSAVEGAVETAGPRRGASLRLGASVADDVLGSTESLYAFDAQAAGYLPMPWRGNHTLAARVAGAVSAGSYAERRLYFVGGYDLENNDLVDTLLSGVYDGSFVLRGYPAGAYAGRAYLLSSLEYRAPLFVPNWGPSTFPLFLRRVDGAVFADYGGAFDRLELDRTRLARRSELLAIPGLHSAYGLELWLGVGIAYRLSASFKLGWAYGVGPEAVPSGQFYFLAGSGF